MKKSRLVAHAKPNEHKVYTRRGVYVYCRIRKRELTDDQCYVQLMRQVAKVALRRVIAIVNSKKPKT